MRSDSARTAASRWLESAGGGLRPALHRVGQHRNAMFQRRQHVAAAGRGKAVDLLAQRLQMIAQLADRLVRGDVGRDATQRRDRLLHLLDAVVGARPHDQVDLVGQVADRGVVAGELFGGGQRADHAINVVQRPLDARERVAVAAVLTAAVDALGERADFVLERLDGAARQRFGQQPTDLGQFLAERRDRLIEAVGTPQRLHLAGDLLQLPLEARQRRCWRRCRQRRARWALTVRRTVELATARGDLGDRVAKIKAIDALALRAEGRRRGQFGRRRRGRARRGRLRQAREPRIRAGKWRHSADWRGHWPRRQSPVPTPAPAKAG